MYDLNVGSTGKDWFIAIFHPSLHKVYLGLKMVWQSNLHNVRPDLCGESHILNCITCAIFIL